MDEPKKNVRPSDTEVEQYREVTTDWLYDAIDLLASEYGWAKADILEKTYFDELLFLREKITDRYALINGTGDSDVATVSRQKPYYAETELDRTGFEQMRLAMLDNPRIIQK